LLSKLLGNYMYLKDPKNGLPSVSLTLAVVSFVLVLGFSIAAALGKSSNPETLLQLFCATAALYFGRRITIGKQTISNKETDNE